MTHYSCLHYLHNRSLMSTINECEWHANLILHSYIAAYTNHSNYLPTQQEQKGFSTRRKFEVLYSLRPPYKTGVQRTSCFCRDNSKTCNTVMESFSLALRELVLNYCNWYYIESMRIGSPSFTIRPSANSGLITTSSLSSVTDR